MVEYKITAHCTTSSFEPWCLKKQTANKKKQKTIILIELYTDYIDLQVVFFFF